MTLADVYRLRGVAQQHTEGSVWRFALSPPFKPLIIHDRAVINRVIHAYVNDLAAKPMQPVDEGFEKLIHESIPSYSIFARRMITSYAGLKAKTVEMIRNARSLRERMSSGVTR